MSYTNRRNGIDRLALLLANDVGINLGDADVGMPQQLADGVKLGSVSDA